MDRKKIKVFFICLAASALSMPGTALAGTESGLYIGAGAGNATVKQSGLDESDSAYKLFTGYNIGFIPLVDLAMEISYVDFGKPENSTGSVELSGVDAFGLAGYSFGPFGVFAKAGIISWSSDASFGGSTISDSGTDTAYGVGARFAIGSFAVRAEYELFDLDDADLDMVSVSGVFTF
jgi:outer membrane immunogenic protein